MHVLACYPTVNRLDVAVPDGFVTVITPERAFAGIVSVIVVGETILNFAATPWIVTDVVCVKFVPESVTVLPAFAFAGASFAIVGAAALSGRKPVLTTTAWASL